MIDIPDRGPRYEPEPDDMPNTLTEMERLREDLIEAEIQADIAERHRDEVQAKLSKAHAKDITDGLIDTLNDIFGGGK